MFTQARRLLEEYTSLHSKKEAPFIAMLAEARDACDKYQDLTGENVPTLRVFQAWSWMTWANKFIEQGDQFNERAKPLRQYLSGDRPRQRFFNSVLPMAYALGVEDIVGGAPKGQSSV